MRPHVLLVGSLVLPALLLFVGGCDVIDATTPEPIVLPTKEQTFTFRFDAASAGGWISSAESADLGPALLSDGFRKDEIIAATVTAGTAERIFPIGAGLNVFQGMQVRLEGAGASPVVVAGRTGLPDARTATLTAESSRDVAAFLKGASFRAGLQVQSAGLTPGIDYEVHVTLRFRVEVEGV